MKEKTINTCAKNLHIYMNLFRELVKVFFFPLKRNCEQTNLLAASGLIVHLPHIKLQQK